jgi:uncharacterized protein YndB with AHSA1/START domain
MTGCESDPVHRRYRQGRVFPRAVAASVDIQAPAADVWAVLVDFSRYPEWNPFTSEVDAELVPGGTVRLRVNMPGRRKLEREEQINRVEPDRALCWGMHLGHRAILCANRWQVLEPVGAGTRYTTVDRFSGLLVPLVMALYGGPMQRGFQQMADALKARVEGSRPPLGIGC